MEGLMRLQPSMPDDPITKLLQMTQGEQRLDYNDVMRLLNISDLESAIKMPPSHRDAKGQIEIVASHEKYFGEKIRKYNTGKDV